jgi:hypothetical protein
MTRDATTGFAPDVLLAQPQLQTLAARLGIAVEAS